MDRRLQVPPPFDDSVLPESPFSASSQSQSQVSVNGFNPAAPPFVPSSSSPSINVNSSSIDESFSRLCISGSGSGSSIQPEVLNSNYRLFPNSSTGTGTEIGKQKIDLSTSTSSLYHPRNYSRPMGGSIYLNGGPPPLGPTSGTEQDLSWSGQWRGVHLNSIVDSRVPGGFDGIFPYHMYRSTGVHSNSIVDSCVPRGFYGSLPNQMYSGFHSNSIVDPNVSMGFDGGFPNQMYRSTSLRQNNHHHHPMLFQEDPFSSSPFHGNQQRYIIQEQNHTNLSKFRRNSSPLVFYLDNIISNIPNHEHLQLYSLSHLSNAMKAFGTGIQVGLITAMAINPTMSRILQEKLNNNNNNGGGKANEREIEMVVSEITFAIHYAVHQIEVDFINRLINSPFGSSFMKILFEVSSVSQRNAILDAVTKNCCIFASICKDNNGHDMIMGFFNDQITHGQISTIVNVICMNVLEICCNHNGKKIILEIISRSSPSPDHDHVKVLLNVILNDERICIEMALHKVGCVLLQKFLENSSGICREKLGNVVANNAVILSLDECGNYMVQFLMKKNIKGVHERLFGKFRTNFVELSCNKYGSNVVERFISQSPEEYINAIITEFIKTPFSVRLLTSPFANYVIQTALNYSSGNGFRSLANFIFDHNQLVNDKYAKKIFEALEQKISDMRGMN